MVTLVRMALAGVLAVWLGCMPARGENLYRLNDLGVLPGGLGSQGAGLNNHGEAVGWATNGLGFARGFYASGADSMVDLETLGGHTSRAFAINNAGQATGISAAFTAAGVPVQRAFVSERGGAMRELPALTAGSGYAVGRAINDLGQVAGASRDGSALLRAVIWEESGAIRNLGALAPWGESEALGLNGQGVAVGWSHDPLGVRTAVRFRLEGAGAVVEALTGLPVGRASTATAIADSGWVVGHLSGNDGRERAFLHTGEPGAVPIDLHDSTRFHGWSSYALDLNAAGLVVGRLDGGQNGSRAFLWTSSAGMIDLNTLLDPDVGDAWLLTTATGINAAGQIVGTGIHNGQARAFVLTPTGHLVPEPSALVLGLLGGLGLVVAAGRRRRVGSAGTEPS